MRVTCPAHIILLDMSTLLVTEEDYVRTIEFSLLLLHVPVIFFLC
jgi:hypothetical protein